MNINKIINCSVIVSLAIMTLSSCHVIDDDSISGESSVSFEVTMGRHPGSRSVAGQSYVDVIPAEKDTQFGTLRALLEEVPMDDIATRGTPVTQMYDSFVFFDGRDTRKAVRNHAVTEYPLSYYPVNWVLYKDLALSSTVSLFCWAPEESDGFSFDKSSSSLTYEIPASSYYSTDIIYAESEEFDYTKEGTLDISFGHLLGGFEIRTGSVFTCGNVSPCRLEGVYRKGTYDIGSGTWSVDPSSLGDITLIDNIDFGDKEQYYSQMVEGTGLPVIADENTLFLPPQTFPEGARLYLGINLAGPIHYFTLDLSGVTISPGRMLSISLSSEEMFMFKGTGVPGATLTFKKLDSYNYNPNAPAEISTVIDENGNFELMFYSFYGFSPKDTETKESVYTITQIPGVFASPYNKYHTLNLCFENFVNLREICDIPSINTTTTKNMFKGCRSLINAPNIRLDHCDEFTSMFEGCESLIYVPDYYTPMAGNMSYMFKGCSSLVNAPNLNTGNVTDMTQMFMGCSSLVNLPDYDTGKVKTLPYMYNGCSSLVEIPLMDCSSVTKISSAFIGCTNLTTVGGFTGLTVDLNFRGCENLSVQSLLNIANTVGDHSANILEKATPTIPPTIASNDTDPGNIFSKYNNIRVSTPSDGSGDGSIRVRMYNDDPDIYTEAINTLLAKGWLVNN